jgi:uncharacterized membrane protein
MTDPLYSNPSPMRYPLEDMLNDKTYVVSIYVLFLLGFLSGGATTVVGLIMAYILKVTAGPLAFSHYRFAIRTFWLTLGWSLVGCCILAVGVVLSMILIGIPILIVAGVGLCAILIWFGVRCVLGLIAAVDDRPCERPRAWIV